MTTSMVDELVQLTPQQYEATIQQMRVMHSNEIRR